MRRCVWFLAVTAALMAGAANFGRADRLAEAFGTAQVTEDADGPALLSQLDATAHTLWRAGDLAQETALRQRALQIALVAFGPELLATAQAITALALAHIDRRRWLDAEPLLILAARMLPDAHKDRLGAAIFAGQARVALARGDADAALAFARRAVESARHDPRDASAEPLRALGATLAALERFEEARRAVEEALDIDRRQHGPEAAETARSLSQLGNLYLRWARPEDALMPLQQATAIDQLQLGPAHPFIADDLYDLGIAYDALNRPDRARRMLLAALVVLDHCAGGDTSRAGYAERALSRIEQQLGHSAAAEMAQSEARRILDKAESEERRRERRS